MKKKMNPTMMYIRPMRRWSLVNIQSFIFRTVHSPW